MGEGRAEAEVVPGVVQEGRGELAGLGLAVPAPQLPHLLPPVLHQRLVLRHPQLLPVHDAGPLGARPVPAVVIS